MLSKVFKLLGFSLLAVFAHLSLAQTAQDEPQQVVQSAIDAILSDIEQNREHYLQDSAAFYSFIDEQLNNFVDIEGVTKSIMTVKYTKQATPARLLKFYGDAILGFGKIEIKYLSSKISDKDANRAAVNTEAKTANNSIYPISYTMVKIGDKWLLRNVIVGGINIGKLFREQFIDQMKKNRNNLDATIADWDKVVKAQIETEQEANLTQENATEGAE